MHVIFMAFLFSDLSNPTRNFTYNLPLWNSHKNAENTYNGQKEATACGWMDNYEYVEIQLVHVVNLHIGVAPSSFGLSGFAATVRGKHKAAQDCFHQGGGRRGEGGGLTASIGTTCPGDIFNQHPVECKIRPESFLLAGMRLPAQL